jgi:hypothetical protein
VPQTISTTVHHEDQPLAQDKTTNAYEAQYRHNYQSTKTLTTPKYAQHHESGISSHFSPPDEVTPSKHTQREAQTKKSTIQYMKNIKLEIKIPSKKPLRTSVQLVLLPNITGDSPIATNTYIVHR